MRFSLLGALFLFWATTASADNGALEPSTPWGIDYSDNQCKLYRNFGEGDDTVFLEIRQFAPEVDAKFVIAGKKLQARPGTDIRSWLEPEDNATLSSPNFAKFGDEMEGLIFTRPLQRSEVTTRLRNEFERGGDWRSYYQAEAESIELGKAREAEITHLTIDRGLTNKVSLHIGKMSAPMNAMRTCLYDLMSHWGLDPAVQKNLRSKPIPKSNPGALLKGSDYPRTALFHGYSGIVSFRLSVDETGKVTDCDVQEAPKEQEFAKVTCSLLTERAKFEPALDSNGNPVKGYWANRVRFEIINPRFN